MPTYEYKCDNGHKYIEVRSMNDKETNKTCTEDGCGVKLKRVFSSPPVTFKGGGFSSTSSI